MKTEELIKAKKYIEHVIGTIKHDGHLVTIQTDWILPDLEKALAAIGGDGCSSDTDELSVEKLQEQLNTAKMALISIKWRTERDELETYHVERNHDIHKDAIDALAAIGGFE
ncbi:hypothetical protein RR45_GL000176 [Lactococcus chungangensis CAU 28 = DSM 22330]|uniref:Uncharacterized protein n=1 Tax=Pseudolactococcus chungangensis CAU 28 = DSM 22330 TaxID=1122154 RepID=A0A1K2HB17_9LACT|nr:hypothetical protein [Lactococcus chungangensis]PCS04857.1 hypothetical protein RR45_GL000176 [Lactococcus chungangensis CAU 28 = DSM 22330]SFZ74000.1 hypothetical protein SAMN02746068_01038 [Lactococcus chungangensis CAU 28 = DSM 22330]